LQNLELGLLSKIITEQNIYDALNSNVGKCLKLYGDIWSYVVDYHHRYKQLPTVEIIKSKFSEFEVEDVSDVSLEYIIDELQLEHIRTLGEDIILDTANMLKDDNPRNALMFAFAKLSNLVHETQIVKDVDLAKDYGLRVNSLKERVTKTNDGKEILGITSGIPAIDYIFGGWQQGDFITLMGWSETAKTWLAIFFAVHAWLKGYSPLVFSLEIDDKQYGYRVDTLMAGGKFSNNSLMNARGINVSDYEKWTEEFYEGKQPFYLITTESMEEINQFTIQSKVEQYNPDLVIIDYHHLVDDARRGKTETEKVKNLSRDFKKMAGKYAVPLIDIVSVTMDEGHTERTPELHEVAWSKAIAYDSDLVLAVKKEGNIQTIESKKNRRGQAFAFKLYWDFDKGVVTQHDWD
jgi:replicative DNA helicase